MLPYEAVKSTYTPLVAKNSRAVTQAYFVATTVRRRPWHYHGGVVSENTSVPATRCGNARSAGPA